MTIRTLIVDDEAHARARIRPALKDEPDFALVVGAGQTALSLA
jgi:chemotaxis response regulator CheB